MMGERYFRLYLTDITVFDFLSNTEAGMLFSAMMKYANTGEDTVFDGYLQAFWVLFRSRIDYDLEEYDDRR